MICHVTPKGAVRQYGHIVATVCLLVLGHGHRNIQDRVKSLDSRQWIPFW